MQRRYYACDTCQHRFEIVCDKRDPDPDCPKCAFATLEADVEAEHAAGEARIQKMVDEGKAPGVIGVKSKAIDFTQKMAEETYGLTDMRDNTRPGEANFKPESQITTSEAEAKAREIMEAVSQTSPLTPTPAAIQSFSGSADPIQTFWGGSNSVQGQPGPGGGAPANLSAAAPAAAQTRAEGNDPVAKLHAAGKQGLLGNNYEVVGKAPIPKETAL